MTRERLLVVLALLGLLGVGYWLSTQTEWVDHEVPRGARGEARDNPVYAFEQLLRRLGLQTSRREALDTLPPTGARLLLLSDDWVLQSGRAEQIEQWVLRGGHLLLVPESGWHEEALEHWLPLESALVKRPPREEEPTGDDAPVAAREAAARFQRLQEERAKRPLRSTPALWGELDTLRPCAERPSNRTWRPRDGEPIDWALEEVAPQRRSAQPEQLDPPEPVRPALRVRYGKGSVTALHSGWELLGNQNPLRCDNALVLAAAVQAEPGAQVWIYLHEKREPLLRWLWQQAWVVIVIGLLALAAQLWRVSVRFGPRLPSPPRLRRSISEQVSGLGAYLQRGSPQALLAAQRRALEEAALRHLRGYAALPMTGRAQALATATGLPAQDLAAALQASSITRAALPRQLQLLETARRRLLSPSNTKDEQP